MQEIVQIIASGLLLGLSSGLSPGPLLTLVVTQTLKHNKMEGIKVAVSPLITDLPIILLSLFVINKLAQIDLVFGILSFVGGLFIAYLGVESLRIKELNLKFTDEKINSLKKGILANFLNPSPYLFWATIGAPLIFKATSISPLVGVSFLLSFYITLLGSKILIANIAAHSKDLITGKVYLTIMKLLGLAMLGFSVYFFYEAVGFFGLAM